MESTFSKLLEEFNSITSSFTSVDDIGVPEKKKLDSLYERSNNNGELNSRQSEVLMSRCKNIQLGNWVPFRAIRK
jgi:hypothetical protein